MPRMTRKRNRNRKKLTPPPANERNIEQELNDLASIPSIQLRLEQRKKHIRHLEHSICFLVAVAIFIMFIVIWLIPDKQELGLVEENNAINSNPSKVTLNDSEGQYGTILSEIPKYDTNSDTYWEEQAMAAHEKHAEQLKKQNIINVGPHTITAYCPCVKCCGEYSNTNYAIGSSGKKLVSNYSVAAPKHLPYGTLLIIDGNIYEVEDRPADWIVEKYDGRIIDIYFDTHEAAEAFGKQSHTVSIIRNPDIYDNTINI